ncbi:baseplate wedge protein [Pseudomonas phage Dolphis]|nr:baseplate wedge protein [Pseudomonas phage Dolphis]
MKSALAKLLEYPHRAVFNKSPQAVLAFTLNRDGGLTWTVFDRVLTVVTPAKTYTYDLSAFTIGSLISRLKVDKFTVAYQPSTLFARSATVLVDAKGDTSESNGDRVMGYTSILWALYAAYSAELVRAKEQVVQAIRQMIIWQSEGEWTDVWGSLFGISREENETDAVYASRIPKEAFRLRVNKYAIELAIRDLTGRKVFIGETWPDMFRLDESVLSGSSRFPSGEEYRYGYIQPVAKELFDWDGVLDVIERNKAAGVVVLPPRVEITEFVNASLRGLIRFGIQANFGALVFADDAARLDVMELGNTYPNRNWRLRIDADWVITPPGHLMVDAGLGILDEFQGNFLIYDDQVVFTPIREDELAPIGVNFNGWSPSRTWSDDDTWKSRGGPVPYSAQVRIDHTIEDIPFVTTVDALHEFVHITMPGSVNG